MTYSSLFFDACQKRGLGAYAISSCSRKMMQTVGAITAENRPELQNHGKGFFYHLNGVWQNVRRVILAIKSKAKIVVIGPCTHHFVFALLPLAGRRLIFSLHNTISVPNKNSSLKTQILGYMDALCFQHAAIGFLCVSKRIENQVQQVCHGRARTRVFLPLYRASRFQDVPDAAYPARGPFRLLYIGRIERDKGVMDLTALLEKLRAQRIDVSLDVCGNGSAQDTFSDAIRSKRLDDLIRFHGFCSHTEILSYLGDSHAVIVPTTSDFSEGLNKVVIEGILAGRPVIATTVCPAVDYVAEGVIEVEPSAIDQFVEAVTRLARDAEFYRCKASGARNARAQFFDSANGWNAAFLSILEELEETV